MNQKKNRRLHIRTHQDCDGASVEGDGAQRHSGEVGRALRTGPRLDGGAGRRLGPARGPTRVEGGGGDGVGAQGRNIDSCETLYTNYF